MKNNDFTPEGYEVPKGNANYMKFVPGENKFRILSKPIIGWEYWGLDDKPVRIKGIEKPVVDQAKIRANKFGKKDVKHFFAFLVWNYKDESIQILEVTQAVIQNSLVNLSNDPEWGSPYSYDLKVTKTGEDKDTKYQLVPCPHKAIAPSIVDAFNKKACDLDQLFAGADPFAPSDKVTPMEHGMPF